LIEIGLDIMKSNPTY